MSEYVIYYAPMTRAIRLRWLCEEMGLDYRLERPAFKRGDVGGEDYRAINPVQKLPSLVDGDEIINESVAGVEYIANKNGPSPMAATPADPDYGAYLQWLHFGEGGLGMYVNIYLGHTVLLPEERRAPGMAKWADGELTRMLDFLAQQLGDREFVLPRGFCAADVSIGYILYLASLTGRMDTAPAPVQAYLARLMDRPAWKRATAD